MNFRILMVLAITLSFSSIASAQERLTGTITLRDVVRVTLSSNPQLSSFPLREEALFGLQETAELKPPVTFNAGLENSIGTGNLSGLSGAETTFSLSRVVELGDKRSSRVGVVNSRLELLEAEQRVVEIDLLSEATFLFIEVAAAQERVALQQQARELAEQTLDFLAPLVEAGQTPQLELLRANAALNRSRNAERYALSILDSARVKLSSMWGSQNPQFDQVEGDIFATGESGMLTAILLDLENNPDIELLASEQRLLTAQLREVRTQSKSNIQWTAGVRHLKEIDDTGLVFGFSMPLFSKERNSGAIRSAQANLSEIDARRLAALNKMRGQLVALHRQLTQAISEVGLLQAEVLPLLAEVLDQTRNAYENGNYSYVELISAQKEFLDARLALISSAANAHTLRAEIERLSGATLSTETFQ